MLSRTASHVYWMARYMERAENSARILDITHHMSLLPQDNDDSQQEWYAPLNITGTLDAFRQHYDTVNAANVLQHLALDPANHTSIYSSIYAARENARATRGTITSEMWESLNSTWLELQGMKADQLQSMGVSRLFEWVKERSHLFRGVTHGTMLRDEGFHFIRLGTFLERADSTARILDVKYHILLPSLKDVGGAVDYYQWGALLRSVSAFESYRKVYRDVITPLRVAELLILREDMPRSLHVCLNEISGILSRIDGISGAEARRRAGDLHARLHYTRISDIFQFGLHEYLTDFLLRINELADEIDQGFWAYRGVDDKVPKAVLEMPRAA
jgi:uncharacterized alpha-E superfamily protein